MEANRISPMPTTADGAVWLPFMLNPVRSNATGNPTARLLDAVFATLVSTFAHAVLSTTDPEELESQIDSILDDADFGARYQSFLQLLVDCTQNPSECSSSQNDLERLWAKKLGSNNVPKLQGVIALASSLFSTSLKHIATKPVSVSAEDTKPLLWFLEDWRLPAEVKRILLGTLRAEVCMLVISAALAESSVQPGWLITQLLAVAEQGYRGHLRLMASVDPASVSTELVPLDERLDANAMRSSEAQRRLSIELLTLKHIESGEGVFSPFGEIAPEDD